MVKKSGSHNKTLLHPNPCYNKVWIKWTALFVLPPVIKLMWLIWWSIRLGIEQKGCWFEPHCWPSNCVVSLSETLYPLLSTGSTQGTITDITEKLLTGT